jgi:nucleotide-binding universal stress UspA family protein
MEYVNTSGPARVVVCATRFTATCDSAIDVAIELARGSSARLVLVHVVEPGSTRAQAQPRLEAAAARAGDLQVDSMILRGEPGHAIARLAQHEHADVIVVGEGRPSESLIPNGVPEVIERASDTPLLEVGLGESYADVVRRLDKVPAPGRHCLVCAKEAYDLICRSCQNQITGEALEGKHRVDQAATRGLGS